MAHPKSRISKQRKRKRRTHYKITDKQLPQVSSCSNCGAPVLRHRICGACGSYRGRTIINMEETLVTPDTEATIDDVQIEE